MKGKKDISKYSIKDLLSKISELVSEDNFPVADKFTTKALSIDPLNPQVLLQAAIVKFELGEPEPAINVEPDVGYEKYLYLGQMSVEHESIKNYEKGILLITALLENTPNLTESEQLDLKRKISEAYISMTEIYLSDLCFEADAELRCENYLKLGELADPTCAEIYQTLASVRMSQNRVDEAKEALNKSISIWKGLETGNPLIPSYENRLSLTRLLIECDLLEDALVLLESLQKEDDMSVDLFYLYGFVYYLQGEKSASIEAGNNNFDDEDRHELWIESAECLQKALKIISFGHYYDQGVIDHTHQLFQEIVSVYPNIKKELKKQNDIIDSAEIVDEAWETDSDSDVMMDTA
ncbi:UPF0661 TPR repeat-containing protein [Smittium culicis]|uniref:UPF0661 TPR repeat-containing protein n=1 Tax=Smittium culicis TaxID=133412 RepID=A0A1R1Y077_9FUNG|nr:UPF0661 TPR repeat-containing protein [Smittium culicis]